MRFDWKTVCLVIGLLDKLNSVFDFVGNIVKACKWVGAKMKQMYIKIHNAKK